MPHPISSFLLAEEFVVLNTAKRKQGLKKRRFLFLPKDWNLARSAESLKTVVFFGGMLGAGFS
jgi:hypothetical protein